MMRLPGLTTEQLDETLMSLGSHKAVRPLTPVEVAVNLRSTERAGASKTEIAAVFGFSDTTMVSRFLKLLTLSPEIQFLVDWGESRDSTIGFSVAVELSGMKETEHALMTSSIISNGLTKTEIKSIRQLTERSGRPVRACIDDVVARRPRTKTQYLVIGQINGLSVKGKLQNIKQIERDDLIRSVVEDLYPEIVKFSAKLGDNQFAIFGGKEVGETVAKDTRFEEKISDSLSKRLLQNASI